MKIRCVTTLYFSPTGNTQKVCKSVADAFDCEKAVLNRTTFDSRYEKAAFGPEDLVIIGVPVYYGRVPRIMTELFRGITVDRAVAVYITTFGNRDYDDALLELKNICEEKGFLSAAAGAFSGRHSFSEKIGTGRPNKEDLSEALDFGRRIRAYLEVRQGLDGTRLPVKGNYPYKAAADLPMAPAVSGDCEGCGLCAKNCPVAAINPDNPRETDGWRCLDCALCVQKCPKQARSFAVPAMQEKILVMEAMFTAPKSNELFMAE